jgi:hypothetical protein
VLNNIKIKIHLLVHQWRPVSDDNRISFAPDCVNNMILKCTAHDPQERPSFLELLNDLADHCLVEVEASSFHRHPHDNPLHGNGALDTNQLETTVSIEHEEGCATNEAVDGEVPNLISNCAPSLTVVSPQFFQANLGKVAPFPL